MSKWYKVVQAGKTASLVVANEIGRATPPGSNTTHFILQEEGEDRPGRLVIVPMTSTGDPERWHPTKQLAVSSEVRKLQEVIDATVDEYAVKVAELGDIRDLIAKM